MKTSKEPSGTSKMAKIGRFSIVSQRFHKVPWYASRLPFLWKSSFRPLWPFLVVFAGPDGSYEIFFVSDCFHEVPWHVSSLKHFKSLRYPWKKCIKTAVAFENHPFGQFHPFRTFLTAHWKSSLSLIGSIRYPDMWGVQNTASLYHTIAKMCVKTTVLVFFANFSLKFLLKPQTFIQTSLRNSRG